jgi:uncharacterized protein YdaU (DUF1376 family)
MHYYQFNIGDYASHTTYLSEMEDLAYRRLLDWYYLHESPISLDVNEVCVRIRMRSHCDCIAFVLHEFFEQTDTGWIHHRANAEIAKTGDKSSKASASAKIRWDKERDANALQTQSERNATQDTGHTTQDTPHKTQKKTATRGARLPADWKPNPELVAWSKAERPDLDLRKVFAEFKDYWSSVSGSAGVKLKWDATWRNWVRKQTAAKTSFAQQASDVVRSTVPYAQDAALRKVEEDHKAGSPPPAHIREMMRGILGVKNA